LSPSELVEAAAAASLRTISITDHDTTDGIASAAEAASRLGIQLISGIEITAVADGHDVHMLGYFIDRSSARLQSFLAASRADRLRRVREMCEKLEGLGAPVTPEPLLDAAACDRSVGRPHVAAALISAGHVQDRQEAFDRFLNADGPAYVPRRGASPEDVIALLHHAGGIASLAHPGTSRRDEFIRRLASAGLDAIEAVHSDHDGDLEQHYRALAADLRLPITGGSDYHGPDTHHARTLGSVTLPAADFSALCSAATRSRV
jgi:3',5'-nucleoside bisphosphate phosphatase